MVSLLLLSDTHVPKRAHDLQPEVWDAIADADIVVHAGDWVSLELFERIRSRAKVLHAVYGNNDGAELRDALPEVARWKVAGIRFAAVHETGPAAGREARMDIAFPDTDVLVFGHSHIPWDSVTPAGLRLLNPGSPTDRRRQPNGTYLTAEATDGCLQQVQLVPLANRASPRVRSHTNP
jgi:putative phosphoesterase